MRRSFLNRWYGLGLYYWRIAMPPKCRLRLYELKWKGRGVAEFLPFKRCA